MKLLLDTNLIQGHDRVVALVRRAQSVSMSAIGIGFCLVFVMGLDLSKTMTSSRCF